jgi:acyl CoA:acetate/3-ketoacid CoA transferase beta subunit
MASGARRINPILLQTYTAGTALAAHRIVIWHATDADVVIYPAAAPDTQMVGVTMEAAASGADVEVCVLGPCLVTVDGNAANIAAGDAIEVHSTSGYGGKRALSDGTTYREILGMAMEASTADNDEIVVFVGKTPWVPTA